MSVKIYNKLVRDKITMIIEKDGKRAEIRIASKEETKLLLEEKLKEEVAEYMEDKNLEELADIMEVVFALAKSMGYSEEELIGVREKKREERGGFDEGDCVREGLDKVRVKSC